MYEEERERDQAKNSDYKCSVCMHDVDHISAVRVHVAHIRRICRLVHRRENTLTHTEH